MKAPKPKPERRKAKTTHDVADERAVEVLAGLLKRSVDRASRALDETHREVKRSTRRIAAMETRRWTRARSAGSGNHEPPALADQS